MGRKGTNSRGINPLKAQLLLARLVMLVIPLYMFTLSPTCGAFGPSIPRSDFLTGLTFAAVIPGIIFSLIGVLGRSNVATGISGLVITLIIVLNTTVELYFTVFDFVVVLFYLEISSSFTALSEIADTIEPGTDETVSYNYRLVVRQYVRRLVATSLVTLAGSTGALVLAAILSVQIGTSGLTLLTTASFMLVFLVLALKYGQR